MSVIGYRDPCSRGFLYEVLLDTTMFKTLFPIPSLVFVLSYVMTGMWLVPRSF